MNIDIIISVGMLGLVANGDEGTQVVEGSNPVKGKNFQLTLNKPELFEPVRDYLKAISQFQYGIATLEEAPTTGHKHVHIYVQYKNTTKLSMTKLKGAHLERCRGSAQQNIEYIKKTKQPEKAGTIIWEEGTPKKKGGPKIKDILAMDKEAREDLPACYFNIVSKINAEEAKDISIDDWHKEIEVYWIHGPSGIGKTRLATKMIKEKGFNTFNSIKYESPFWHGVTDHNPIALYDDFRDSHMKPTELINLIDYNIHTFNIKGGSIQNKYKYIIITSIQDPELIYKNIEDEEPRKQWLRRIKEIIHME